MKIKLVKGLLFSSVLGVLACSEQSVVSKTKEIKILPGVGSAGAKILKEKCSECHGAPHPDNHTADQWPNVVKRMQMHRIKKAYGAIPENDEKTLISYLQKHAKQ